jgi:Flp pilus assembly pilin Flp
MGDIRESIRLFWIEEDAVGVVELILILVVLIALVAIFKSQLLSLVKTLLSTVTSKSTEITK